MLKNNTKIQLGFADLLCIQQLWANPALENDADFFQRDMVYNFAYYKTKHYLEKTCPHFGGFLSLFYAKSEYQKQYLREISVWLRATD